VRQDGLIGTDPVGAVQAQERRLVGELAGGTAVSGLAGAALWLLGRRSGRPVAAAFGRQTLAWAVVDAAIVGWGRRGFGRSPADADAARAKARRLRTVTLVNAGLDVGYLALGTRVARGRSRGDGLAIVVQGLFLLWLDARHAHRFDVLARRP
jgi:hypothetical protein